MSSQPIPSAQSLFVPATQAMEALNQLLGRPDLATYVPQIPAQTFYFLVRELGLSDAVDILRYASVEQIQIGLDLDGWRRDVVDREAVWPWLEALLAGEPKKIATVFHQLDHEWVVGFLGGCVRVYECAAEEMPEDLEGPVYLTPDGFYAVELVTYVEEAQRLLEALYRVDPALARRVLMGTRWDQGSETEEMAYRWHQGRLADLGYPPREEALALYQELPLQAVRMGENTALVWEAAAREQIFWPREWVAAWNKTDVWLREVLLALPAAEQATLSRSLMHVLNQALSAQSVGWTDTDALQAVVEQTLGLLSLGLEALVLSGDPGPEREAGAQALVQGEPQWRLLRAHQALRTVSLVRIFRLGYSVVAHLRKLARLLQKSKLVTLNPQEPASLLEEPYREVVEGLLSNPLAPLYNTALDQPPGTALRGFRAALDVKRTRDALDEGAQLVRFLTLGLGLRPEKIPEAVHACYNLVQDVRWTHVVGTVLCNAWLQRPLALVPLSLADVGLLRDQLLVHEEPPLLRPAPHRTLLEQVRNKVKERSLHAEEEQMLWTPATERLLQQTFMHIAHSLAAWPQTVNAPVIWPVVTGFLVHRAS